MNEYPKIKWKWLWVFVGVCFLVVLIPTIVLLFIAGWLIPAIFWTTASLAWTWLWLEPRCFARYMEDNKSR